MSNIKISELATNAISLTDFFAKADASGVANKNTVQGLSNFLAANGNLSFRGVLLASDAAVTQDGIYVAGDAGTYTNNGGLVLTVSNQIVLISITETQTVFDQAIFPITLTIDAVPTDASTNALQSGGAKTYIDAKIKDVAINASDSVSAYTGKSVATYSAKKILFDEFNEYSSIVGTEIPNGYYQFNDGSFVANTGWMSKKFDVENTNQIYATAEISGSPTALAIYKDVDDNYLDYEFRGTNSVTDTYTRQLLTIPANTKFLYMSTKDAFGVAEEITSYDIAKQTDLATNTLGVSDNLSGINFIKSKAQDYFNITGVNNGVNGYYQFNDGSFVANTGWMSKKFDVENTNQIYATAEISGSPTALAIYKDVDDNYLGFETRGSGGVTTTFTRELLTLPSGTRYVYMSTKNNFGVLEDFNFNPLSETEISTLINTKTLGKVGIKTVWYGTSIPAVGYPQIVASNLGFNVQNQALGSSMARAFNAVTGTFVGLHYINCLKSLSQTKAEKQSIMDNWQTNLDSTGLTSAQGGAAPFSFGWRDLLIGTPPLDYTTFASAATILGWSYEDKLLKYLDSTHPNYVADVNDFIFDHGHNDVASGSYDPTESSAIDIPAIRNDRTYFLGAMNFLIDLVYEYNPRARVFLIGHYEDARKTNVYKAQNNFAQYKSLPLCRLFEQLGFTQQTVETTGFWSSGVWSNSGGALQTLTMTQIYLEDDLHPSSQPTKDLIAKNISKWFLNYF